MNYYVTGVLIIMMVVLAFCARPAHAGSTQTNTSGSNTAIEGGYTSTATTTYESGSTSTSTTTNTTNSDIKSAPPSAAAPSYNSMTQDVCAVGASAGIQTFGVGVSMIQAGTPCPIDGKIGKDALALWTKYEHERPDYDVYVKRMKKREKKNKEIEAQIQKEFEEAEAAAMEQKLLEEAKKNKKIKDNIDIKNNN